MDTVDFQAFLGDQSVDKKNMQFYLTFFGCLRILEIVFFNM